MSDPMPPRNEPPRNPPAAEPTTRKGVSPLVWILLLIAMLAFGWYFYSQRGAVISPTDPDAPTAIDIGSAQEAAAERERTAVDARPTPRTAAPRTPTDRDPSPVARVQPSYPPAAHRAREEGTVIVRAEVDAAGNPGNVSVARRSSSRELDRAAVDAVRKWKFEPAVKDGKAVASTVDVPVEFRLDTQ